MSLAMHQCLTIELPSFIKHPREKRANDEQRKLNRLFSRRPEKRNGKRKGKRKDVPMNVKIFLPSMVMTAR
jgi:hypothetical protein